MLKAARGVTVRTLDRLGAHAIARVNHLIPPFNDPKVREAMLWTIDQRQYLAAMVGDPQIETVCWAIFVCGAPYESTAGLGDWTKGPDLVRAKALLIVELQGRAHRDHGYRPICRWSTPRRC